MDNADKAYHGTLAQNYEKDRVVETIWEKEQAFMRSYVEKLEKGGLILDVPVGTGRFIDLYLKHGMSVTGMDISEDMLAESRKKYGNIKNVKLKQGDATALPYEKASMDYIVCWRLVHLVPSIILEKMISEFARVARKEIIIQTFDPAWAWKPSALASRAYHGIRTFLEKIVILNRHKKKTPWAHIRNFSHSRSEIVSLLSKYGLSVKEVFTLEDITNREKIYVASKSI